MGCNNEVDKERADAEKPGKSIYVDTFAIDKTEVTVAQYRSCVIAGGYSGKGLHQP
jgi:formylglycine-generating enzyme required for sulfatase activity